MIRLSSVIEQFETGFLSRYGSTLLPSQRKALAAIKQCRSSHSPLMKVSCSDCDKFSYVPHSCGHRSCPHCQHHESQQWIERQCQKQLPVNYFMITFTLPAQLRPLAKSHQRALYQLLFQSAWETLNTFSLSDQELKGTPGMVAVLHTHSRRLDYHPHLHTIMPAGALNKAAGLWRKKKGDYLFNHKALAKVFRAKMLAGINAAGLKLPRHYPEKWVVDCKKVGSGDKAFVYLGRYLYKGVIRAVPGHPCPHGISESIHVRKILSVVAMATSPFVIKTAKATAIKPEHYPGQILFSSSCNMYCPDGLGEHEIMDCSTPIVKASLSDCIIY